MQAEIATLYLVGFGSSALSAPFAGYFADKYGRRTGCMAYTLLQTVIPIYGCLSLSHSDKQAKHAQGQFALS